MCFILGGGRRDLFDLHTHSGGSQRGGHSPLHSHWIWVFRLSQSMPGLSLSSSSGQPPPAVPLNLHPSSRATETDPVSKPPIQPRTSPEEPFRGCGGLATPTALRGARLPDQSHLSTPAPEPVILRRLSHKVGPNPSLSADGIGGRSLSGPVAGHARAGGRVRRHGRLTPS